MGKSREEAFFDNHIQDIIRFRHELHRYPEVSNKEEQTARRVEKWLRELNPSRIITGIGGYGLAACFGNPKAKKKLMFRAELDALPIPDDIDTDYKSKNAAAGHKCGHDGHMANLLGMALWLNQYPPENTLIILLFQPAEETGEGSQRVLDDSKFAGIKPDAIIALHNLPGYSRHSVIIKPDVFTFASTGLIIDLKGTTSHAAYPEDGNSPAKAMTEIIQMFDSAVEKFFKNEKGALITTIHARLGEVAFGTTPGKAVVMATLRSEQTKAHDAMTKKVSDIAKEIAVKYDLKCEIRTTERFESTVNNPEMSDRLKRAAEELGLEVKEPEKAFPWSEDFGRFTSHIPGVLFGLGAGKKYPQLHHPAYDYPDELIVTAIRVYLKIIDYFTASVKT